METEYKRKQKLIAKYERLFAQVKGGIFTHKETRNRLIGKSNLSGRGRKKSDFWNDVRNQIRGALIDLQLFIEVADKSDLVGTDKHPVITEETLKPLVETLLWHPVVHHAEPDLNRAEIARLFIRAGFGYLGSMKSINLSNRQTIAIAVDLANYLAESFKPQNERRYSPPTQSSGYGE